MFAKALVTNQHALAAIGGDSVEKDKRRTKKGKQKRDAPQKANGHSPSHNGGSGRSHNADTRIAIEDDLDDLEEDDPTTIHGVCEPTHPNGGSEPLKVAGCELNIPPCEDESTDIENELSDCKATPPPAGSLSGSLRSSEPASCCGQRRLGCQSGNCARPVACQHTADRVCAVLAMLFRSVQVVFSRLLFILHALFTVWRTADILGPHYWFLLLGLVALLVETVVKLVTKQGVESKWFCTSVFFYLCTVVPAIWLLELDRITQKRTTWINITTSASSSNQTIGLSAIEGIEIPIAFSRDMWVLAIEQTLLFLLIIARWLLPKGDITRDQLSQLLFVYIGIASDISEIFILFEERFVIDRPLLVYAILAAWSFSLFQYTLVLTATRSRKTRVAHAQDVVSEEGACTTVAPPRKGWRKQYTCCEKETWAILTTIMLQDGPFLCIRLYVIIAGQSLTYTILFYTFKNMLVLVLQIYRLVVINFDDVKAAEDIAVGEEVEDNGGMSSSERSQSGEQPSVSNQEKPQQKPQHKPYEGTEGGLSAEEQNPKNGTMTNRHKNKLKP